MLIIFSAVATANVTVVISVGGRGVHEFHINGMGNAGMVVDAPGVELDGERVTVVADSADGGGVDGNHGQEHGDFFVLFRINARLNHNSSTALILWWEITPFFNANGMK